jgi:hypothetical protein
MTAFYSESGGNGGVLGNDEMASGAVRRERDSAASRCGEGDKAVGGKYKNRYRFGL